MWVPSCFFQFFFIFIMRVHTCYIVTYPHIYHTHTHTHNGARAFYACIMYVPYTRVQFNTGCVGVDAARYTYGMMMGRLPDNHVPEPPIVAEPSPLPHSPCNNMMCVYVPARGRWCRETITGKGWATNRLACGRTFDQMRRGEFLRVGRRPRRHGRRFFFCYGRRERASSA